MAVTSMNVSLPDERKDYVKEYIAAGDSDTPSEFVRVLLRGDMQRLGEEKHECLLLQGTASGEVEDVLRAAYSRCAVRSRQSLSKAVNLNERV